MTHNPTTAQPMMINVKWKMITAQHFTGKHEGYDLIVLIAGGLGPYWEISKDDKRIDCAYYHSPTKCEMSCKVQAQRELTKIIEKTKTTHHDTQSNH